MSRIELHCPSCGYDVPPTLMPPPKMFSCPECLEVMPREKLTRLKVLHRNIAGANVIDNTMSATVVGSGSFYDPTQATGTLSIANCVFKAGDTCVLCVACNLSGGSGVNAATVGGSGLVISGVPGSRVDQSVEIWFRGNVTAGSKTVAISSFTANPTACAAVVIAVSGALRTVLSSDGNAAGGSATASFDSTATSALLFANEFAIAAVGSEAASTALGPTWNLGFVAPPGGVGHVGTSSGGPPTDTLIDVAFKALLSNAAVQSTGTLPSAVNNGACVATIKPA